MKHVFVVETDKKLSANTASLLVSLMEQIIADRHANTLVCLHVNQGNPDKKLIVPNDNWQKL